MYYIYSINRHLTSTKSKIRQFHVPGLVEQQVVGFDVAVNVIQFVNGIDANDRLGNVKACHVLGEGIHLNQQPHHVATGHVFHDQIQVFVVLEREV